MGSRDREGELIPVARRVLFWIVRLGVALVLVAAALAAGRPSDAVALIVTASAATPLSITCPAPITAEADQVGGAFVVPGTATATGDGVTISGPSPAVYPLGTSTVTYAATDSSGDSVSCQTTITVVDTTPPSITCPAPITAEATGNESAFVVPGSATAFDIAGPVTITGPAAGSYPLGTTTVTYSATDQSGNRSSCSSSIAVVDTTPPSITCPAPITAEATGNESAFVVPGSATAFDIAGPVTITGPAAGSYPLGTTTVTYSATDQSGNRSSCSSSIAVVDTTPPSITCPAPITAEATGNESAFVVPGSATAFDIAGPVTITGPAAGSYPLGTTTVTYSATDQSGNRSSCSSSIAVVDTTPPSITCPAPITAEATGNESAFVVPGSATAFDIAGPVTITGPAAGSYPLGTTTVTYTATDQSGNQSSCTTTITVVDTTPPSISCPAPITVEATSVAGAFVTPGVATASDIAGPVTITGPAAGTYPLGTTTITYTATDAVGNTSSCNSSITVHDTTAPMITITTPAHTVYAIGQVVNASYSCSDIGSGVATCAGNVASGTPIDTSSAGTKSFTVTALDNVGNTSHQTVTYDVGYNICTLYDSTKAVQSGATIPIRLEICDAAGNDLSSAGITLTAIGVTQLSTSISGPVMASGNANPDNNFRFAGPGYIYNLSTQGLSTGTYALAFTISGDPTIHTVYFQVK